VVDVLVVLVWSVLYWWFVVGDGDEEFAVWLWGWVVDSGVFVELLGARSDVLWLMVVCDVFVLVSVWEVWVLVV